MKDSKEYLSTSEKKGVEEDRKLQQEIGWLSTSHFREIFSKNFLQNCKVRLEDNRRAKLIYG